MPPGDSTSTLSSTPSQVNAARRFLLGGLLQARVCIVPTWRGWLSLLVATVLFVVFVGRYLYAFLAVSDPVPGGVLVVEGWVPTVAARAAVAEFQRHPYLALYVTGLPIEDGNPYIGFRNYAEFTAEKLIEMGAPAASVHAVPAPGVEKDRTYNMAAVLKKQLVADGVSLAKINVISYGPHSRRSRLLYEEAFGAGTQIGVLSVVDDEFDPGHWWKTSAGVRGVISEGIAYLYARLLFHPGDD